MSTIRIVLFGWGSARRLFLRVDRDLFTGPKRFRRKLLDDLARDGRDFARRQIQTQGQGSWPELSPWTKARTGRRKALITAIPRIRAKLSNATATRSATIFVSPGNWTLTQHHDGFTEPPENKIVKIPLKKPGLVGLKGKREIFFKANKPTQVPSRPIWPEGKNLTRMVTKRERIFRQQYQRRLNRSR